MINCQVSGFLVSCCVLIAWVSGACAKVFASNCLTVSTNGPNKMGSIRKILVRISFILERTIGLQEYYHIIAAIDLSEIFLEVVRLVNLIVLSVFSIQIPSSKFSVKCPVPISFKIY